MGYVLKGIVLSVDGDRCRVAPSDNIDQVSPKLMIPSRIEGLSKGDTVAYALFSDHTGIIIDVL